MQRGGRLATEEDGDVRALIRQGLLEARIVGQTESFWTGGVREKLPGWRWVDKTYLSKSLYCNLLSKRPL